MRKNRKDINMPIGKLTKIKDMLPPPEELMMLERTVKITLRLSENSIRFSSIMHRNTIQNTKKSSENSLTHILKDLRRPTEQI